MLREPIEVSATVLTNDPKTARAIKNQMKFLGRQFGVDVEVRIWEPLTARGLLGRIYRAMRARVVVNEQESI